MTTKFWLSLNFISFRCRGLNPMETLLTGASMHAKCFILQRGKLCLFQFGGDSPQYPGILVWLSEAKVLKATILRTPAIFRLPVTWWRRARFREQLRADLEGAANFFR